MLRGLPQPSPLSYLALSQPLQSSLSSNGNLPPNPHVNPPGAISLSVPMAPSISQVSAFSSHSIAGTTVHPSPNPTNPDIGMGVGGLRPRPLDMMMGDEEVYEELERRIDEMRGWLECVEVGLDDLLQSPAIDEASGPHVVA